MTTEKKELTDEELWNQMEAADAAAASGDPAAKPVEAATTKEPATAAAPAKATATAQPTENASTEDDPFAGLPPHVQDFIAGQKTQNDALNKRLKSLEGHIGGMKTQLEAARTAQAQVQQSGGSAPTTQQIKEASKSKEKWNRLVEQYKDFGEAIEERLADVKAQGPAAEQVDPVKLAAFVAGEVATAVQRAKDEMRVENKHEGWQDLTQTPGFVGWVQRQQAEVQKLYTSDKPNDVIRLLDLYKEANKTTIQRQTRLGAAAAAAGPGSAKGAKVKSEAEMSDEELWNALEKQGL